MFTGTFPSFTPTVDQADTLTTALHGLVFWTANPVDFPQLPLASRLCPLDSILALIPLDKAWPSWNLWDQFLCVFIAVTAAAPFINLATIPSKAHDAFSKAKMENLILFIISIQNKLRAELAEPLSVPQAPARASTPSFPSPAEPALRRSPRKR